MPDENEREFEDAKEMQQEVVEKALSLFEEILDSLKNLAEVQTSRLKLIEANMLTPKLVGEQPNVKEQLKERMGKSLEAVDNFCKALANINQNDLELWSFKK